MSDMALEHVMTRIGGATKQSPISVFLSEKPNCLNAVFAKTVITQTKIKSKDRSYIGSYHCEMDLRKVSAELKTHVAPDISYADGEQPQQLEQDF